MEPTAVITQPQMLPSITVYTDMCSQIIKDQGSIIGASLALEQASHVSGLSVDPSTYICTITGSGSVVVNDLIEEYRDFFGHAAVEVCREATSRFMSQLPAGEMPSLLQ